MLITFKAGTFHWRHVYPEMIISDSERLQKWEKKEGDEQIIKNMGDYAMIRLCSINLLKQRVHSLKSKV